MTSIVLERATQLLYSALVIAYRDRDAPTGLIDFFRLPEKPGKVCAVFFSGRSGSFFAQSFFDRSAHPQVLTAHPVALVSFDDVITHEYVEALNSRDEGTEGALEDWCDATIGKFSGLFTKIQSQPTWDDLCVPRELFAKFVKAQVLLTPRGSFSPESLMKIFMIAYRLAQGGPLDVKKSMAFIWQKHGPSRRAKRWIKQTFKDHALVTVVRFPEKAFDSHLIHHAFESISAPVSTLCRRLLFEHMAPNSELLDSAMDGTEFAIRFEDLHQQTPKVLEAICNLLHVPFFQELCQNSFSMQASGRKVSGTRRLSADDFQCKFLNYADRMKVRSLLHEEYRAWGYGEHCEDGLDRSLEAFSKDKVANNAAFGAQTVLAEADRNPAGWLSPDVDQVRRSISMEIVLHGEAMTLNNLFASERERRNEGIVITPLLYSLR